MRAAPAVQVSTRHAGFSHAGVSLALLAAAGVLVAWLVLRDAATARVLSIGATVLGLVVLSGAASLLRAVPLSLRWDTQRWHCGPVATAGEEPRAGEVDVALDLGDWMLLKFRADGANRPWHACWLGVQRRGQEGDWQALRCAVYSPRPDAGLLPGSDPAVAIQPRPQAYE
jgi:hypothetical protein